MIAKDVYELAMALLDEANPDYSKDYEAKASELIEILQRELAFYEGRSASGKVESLESELTISDDTAARIMPYGLAASFALADRNADMYGDYSYMYRSLLRTIMPEETDITDEYGILGGMS